MLNPPINLLTNFGEKLLFSYDDSFYWKSVMTCFVVNKYWMGINKYVKSVTVIEILNFFI